MNARCFLVCLTVIALSGCASTNEVRSSQRLQLIPDLNQITTVEIGQTMLSRVFVKSKPAILVPTETVDPISKSPIPSGLFALSKEDNTGSYYDSDIKVERSNWEAIPHVLIYKTVERTVTGSSVGTVGVFVPSDPSKPSVGYVASGSIKGSVPIKGIQKTIKEEWSQGSFKRELIYTGISKNVISILYREFQDDIARPAFSQDLRYDLSEGKLIGYRGSRFEVISATNTGITYKVLKGID